VEAYDLGEDPDQMTNTASTMDPELLESLEDSLFQLAVCKGMQCNNIGPDNRPQVINEE